MVLAAIACGQPQVAAGLAGGLVAKSFEQSGKFRPGNISWQFHLTNGAMSTCSGGDDFFANEMQPNDLGRLPLVKMAFHSVANVVAQRIHGFGFGKNGMTQRARRKTAFGRLFDEEYKFVHFVRASRPFILPTMSAIRRSISRLLCAMILATRALWRFSSVPFAAFFSYGAIQCMKLAASILQSFSGAKHKPPAEWPSYFPVPRPFRPQFFAFFEFFRGQTSGSPSAVNFSVLLCALRFLLFKPRFPNPFAPSRLCVEIRFPSAVNFSPPSVLQWFGIAHS
jgi:hypothetical protein